MNELLFEEYNEFPLTTVGVVCLLFRFCKQKWVTFIVLDTCYKIVFLLQILATRCFESHSNGGVRRQIPKINEFTLLFNIC